MTLPIGKYFAGRTDTDWDAYEEYETREEAVERAPREFLLGPGDEFVTAIAAEVELPTICVERLLENAAESACEDLEDSDLAEDFLRFGEEPGRVTKAQREELAVALNGVFHDWIKRHGHEPRWYVLVKVKEHEVPAPAPTEGARP